MTMRWLVLLVAISASASSAQVVRIWPHAAPGSERWTQHEVTERSARYGTVEFDVTTPTLTAFLPNHARATGTAVIIAPGGSFRGVTVGVEGEDVARWFQQHGIAAFVLKYRVLDYHAPGNASLPIDSAAQYAIADGVQALRVVRRHAAEWAIDANRIGFVGFSAGGMLASRVLLQPEPRDRPDFAVLVYGAPFGAMPDIPPGLPPVLMLWAQDDHVAAPAMQRFSAALRSAGEPAQQKVFDRGGHGFGLRHQGTSSDGWIDVAYDWLRDRGLLSGHGDRGARR